MLPKFERLQDQKETGFVAAFLGQGGAGKTTVAATVADYKPKSKTLYVDCQGGPDAIVDRDFDYYRPEKFKDFKDLTKEFRLGTSGYITGDNVIIDTVTDLQFMCHYEISPDKVELQYYNQSTAQIMSLTKDWVNISKKYGINVIFTGWIETDAENADGITRRHINFSNKLSASWPGIVTFIGDIEPTDRPPYAREISFVASKKSDAKFRVSTTGPASLIPLKLWVPLGKPLVADLLRTIKDGIEFPVADYTKPKAAA